MNPRDAQEITDTKNKYQLLVDSVQDYAIFLLDSSGYVETWNIGAENMNGYTPGEVIGQHISMFYTPNDISEGKPEKELLQTAQELHIETEDWRVKKDDSRFWAVTTTTALYSESGSLIGFAKITKDITDKKRSKNALIAANRLLKHQHVELEALNNVKDEFVSLASHQLRTPATGIKQFLGLLLEGYAGPLTEQQMAYIQKAYDSNERQIDLVNSLLRTAQIDAGKVILDKSFVTLRTIIDEVVENMREVFTARRQNVEVHEAQPLSNIYIDSSRVRMMLENLIDNASKYTDNDGRIVITLSETKAYVDISIQDTGVGMAEKDLKRIFDKFNRIPNRLSDNVGGTGLGLYWAKKIVELHKGIIKVRSQEGEGTEFLIRLPKGVIRV
ncbi:MAG: sensory box protein [Candidatus Saccharibacteria bacterium]|nr:sensory box protein [Candidatus Saccharibacteria bacterium]